MSATHGGSSRSGPTGSPALMASPCYEMIWIESRKLASQAAHRLPIGTTSNLEAQSGGQARQETREGSWAEIYAGMIGRGLRAPLLVVSDGAPGLIAAIEVHFSRSLRRRCLIHRLRNAVAKIAVADQEAFERDWWWLFNGIEEPPGDKAVAACLARVDGFRANWEKAYPAAVAYLVGDFQSLAVHLRFPAEHWHRVRHTNLIERTSANHAGART